MASCRYWFLHLIRQLARLFQPLLRAIFIRRRSGQATPQRVAVLLDSGVGDTLMATPMLRELRRQLPSATILALVDRATAPVVSRNQDVDGLCVCRYGGDAGRLIWKGVAAIRGFRADILLAPQTSNTLKQIFISFYSGSPIRVKHRFEYPSSRRYSDFEFLFTHSPLLNPSVHRVRDNLTLLHAIGLEPNVTNPDLMFPVSGWSVERAAALLEARGRQASSPGVCIHAGVGTATLKKQWAAERFAELGRRLVTEQGAQIILVGGKGEMELSRQVADAVGSGCIVVAGECSLEATAAIIRNCALFISNDSGLMHLAASVGARGLALFAPTNPVKIGPLGGSIRVVKAGAMDDISVEDVYQECVELIQSALPREVA